MGQKIDVQDLNKGQGYIAIRDQQIQIITGYTKILHSINLTSWTENLDILEHNVNKLNYKNEYPTMTHSLGLLEQEIESLLGNYHHKAKRGLVNVVGKALKYLTGTMDYDDEQEIKQSLDINEKNNKNLIDGLNDQIKINNHFNEVIDNITRQINGQQLEIKRQLFNIGNAINQEFLEVTKMQHAYQIQYDIELLRDQIRKVKENLMLSRLGVLGTDIISPKEIKQFNITINKLQNIKSSAFIYNNQITFVLMIPKYSKDKFYRIIVEPIPNKNENHLEIVTSHTNFLTNEKQNYENINGTTEFKDLKIINGSCICNILKGDPECNFRENNNIEIRQITNNIVITKNIPYTQIIHNCHNYTLNIIGNNLVRFENCNIKINNLEYKNFVYYDNFIIPNFNNVSIKNIVMNYSAEEIHVKQLENRKLIEEVKSRNNTHENINFVVTLTIVTILILIILNFLKKNTKKNNVKVEIKNIDSPEKNLKGGGVTSETSLPFATSASPHTPYYSPFCNGNSTS